MRFFFFVLLLVFPTTGLAFKNQMLSPFLVSPAQFHQFHGMDHMELAASRASRVTEITDQLTQTQSVAQTTDFQQDSLTFSGVISEYDSVGLGFFASQFRTQISFAYAIDETPVESLDGLEMNAIQASPFLTLKLSDNLAIGAMHHFYELEDEDGKITRNNTNFGMQYFNSRIEVGAALQPQGSVKTVENDQVVSEEETAGVVLGHLRYSITPPIAISLIYRKVNASEVVDKALVDENYYSFGGEYATMWSKFGMLYTRKLVGGDEKDFSVGRMPTNKLQLEYAIWFGRAFRMGVMGASETGTLRIREKFSDQNSVKTTVLSENTNSFSVIVGTTM